VTLEGLRMEDNQKGSRARRQNLRVAEEGKLL